MASRLGMHFVMFTLGELQDLYEHKRTVVHVVSIDLCKPYLSVVVLEFTEEVNA